MFSTDKKNNKQVQNYIKLNELGYVTKNEKHYDFTEHLLPIVFSIYIYIYILYERILSKKNGTKQQTKLFSQLNDISR